ncbi:MAG: formylmethanofuran dehydrogenase [Thermodesulfatator sp.]|nr:MAG: formylmethanofuran dehydrogenase [Thermodesulfatator sp.]
MKPEQIKAMEELGAKGARWGELWDVYLRAAFFMHGHVCGGMPLGFRAGVVALKALKSERELNMGKVVFVETGTGHAAGCFADGVQMATGCTFGKGLIERTGYGKWALVLVEKDTRRAVRVSVRPEVMEAAFKSPFLEMRRKGTPPTEVPLEIGVGLVENLFQKSDEQLFVVSEVFEYPLPEKPKPTFEIVKCQQCGEMVAANKVRFKEGQLLCIPCSGYGG